MQFTSIIAVTGSLFASVVYGAAFVDPESITCALKNANDGTSTPVLASEVKAGMNVGDTTGLSLRCSYGGEAAGTFENWFMDEFSSMSPVERSAPLEERATCGCVVGKRCCIICDLDWTSGYSFCSKRCVSDPRCPT